MANTLFVNFDIKDRFNVSSLSGMALSGYSFTFLPTLQSDVTTLSQNRVLWDFGDGTTSSQVSATHTYLFPGQYNVVLYVYGIGGTAYVNSFVPTLSVYDYIPNSLSIGDLPTVNFDQFAGHYRPFDIIRYNSWQTYQSLSAEGYTVGLYVSGAIDPLLDLEQYRRDEWGHLRTLSRFAQKVPAGFTVEYQPVTAVTTDDSLLYIRYNATGIKRCAATDSGAVFAGTSGIATVYFSADTPKNTTSAQRPAVIFCSLNTHKIDDKFTYLSRYYDYVSPRYGNINTEPAILSSVKTRNNTARAISFSTNGIDSEQDAILSSFQMPLISWQNTHIPFVAKLEDEDGFSTRFYPLLSSNIQNLSTNSSVYNLSLVALASSTLGFTVIPSVSFYADFLPTLPQNVGGYIKGYFISPVSALNVKLSGGVTVNVLSGFELDSSTAFYPLTSGICRHDILELFSSDINNLTYSLSTRDTIILSASASRLAISPSNSVGYKGVVVYAITSPTNVSINDIRGASVASIAVSANSLAVDGVNNLWVTIRNTASAIKYTTYGNLSAVALYTGVSSYSACDIDTDTQNNIWVAYNKTGSSPYVVKYNTGGTYLTSFSLTSAFSIDRILIDRNDRVYLTALAVNGPAALSARNDSIYCITSAGALAVGYPLTGFKFTSPTNIALDAFNRLWTVTGQNSAKNVSTGVTVKVGSDPTSNNSCTLSYLVGDTYQNISMYRHG